MKYASVIVLCVFAVVSFGNAVSVTYDTADDIQPNPWQDTWVWTGNGPYGGSTELRINQDSLYDQRIVLEWDLDDIEYATINSAIFYVYRYAGSGALDADIYRVTEYWEEATLVAPAPTYDDGTVWATGSAGDPNGWKTFDLTDLVQGWVDGDFDNYGLICLGSGSGYYQRWYSKESGSNKPYLDIDYSLLSYGIYVSDMDPADGDSGVPVDTDIVFHCWCTVGDGYGRIDTDTIMFTVEDQSRRSGDRALRTSSSSLSTHVNPRPVGEITGTLDIDDSDPWWIICTFTPDEDLPVDLITCTVDGCLADIWGHEMEEDFIWTFSTGDYGVEETTWGAIKAEYE